MHISPEVPVRVIGGGKHTAAAGVHFPPHRHTHWEVVYYASGRIRCPVGDDEYTSEPGLVLITPPNTTHSEIATTAYENYYLGIEAPTDIAWQTAIFDEEALGLRSIMTAIVREVSGHRAERDALIAAYAEVLSLLLTRASRLHTATDAERAVTQAETLIEERSTTAVRIADIASAVGCSPSTLRAHFANLRGTTPLAHLHAIRIRHALGLIRTSTLTLEAIAEQSGYHSASHMARYIRRATGKSAGGLRR